MKPTEIIPGERVQVQTKTQKYEGYLLEHPDPNVILLKLDNGYNAGIRYSKDVKIAKLGKKIAPSPSPKLKPSRILRPQISLVSTGGTITSRLDYSTGAVYPLTKPAELLASVGEVNDLAEFNIVSPFSIFSEDMSPDEWSKIAKAVSKELKSNSKGVIVTHGTDTLGYTAAALSFALGKLNKPVALVGGQRSSDRGSFDGAQNLIAGVHYCLSDINEVAIVMHGSESDDYSLAIPGTKVRKMHTSRRDAFRPINALPIAKIWPDGKIERISASEEHPNKKVKAGSSAKFEKKVALIKYVPGLNPDVLDYYVSEGYKGVVIEGTGLGHVSALEHKESSWLPAIKRAVKSGTFVGIAAQTLYGKLDPYVYSTGRRLIDAGAVHLKDILPETAYVKLSWVLAQTKDSDEIRSLMLANIAGEYSERESPSEFLY